MLAKTPPMGWNSWNTFGTNISEDLVMKTADLFVELGLKDVGYEYIVIDDCWSKMERDENGRLVADPEKFPHGMKYLADYIHSKGLKFGMYSCAGTKTCAGYPSSFDHEFVDAQTFADWGVDYLKYDYCYRPAYVDGPLLYRKMSLALKATGRDILFSACNWGSDDVHSWIRSSGAHMYRSTGDINDSPVSFRDIAFSQIPKLSMSGPACINDTDMLIVGMFGKGNVGFGGCTMDEYRMHFALWCMMASPLMIGSDIRMLMTEGKTEEEIRQGREVLELLKNKDLLRINQDEEVRPCFPVNGQIGDVLMLFRVLSDNEFALGIFNFADGTARPCVEFHDIGLSVDSGYGLDMREIFTGETVHAFENYQPDVAGHSCKVYLCKLAKK